MNRRKFFKGVATLFVGLSSGRALANPTSKVFTKTTFNILPDLVREIISVEDFYVTWSELVTDYAPYSYGEAYNKLVLHSRIFNAILNSKWFTERAVSKMWFTSESVEQMSISTKKAILANILGMEIKVLSIDDPEFSKLDRNDILLTNSSESDRPTRFGLIRLKSL